MLTNKICKILLLSVAFASGATRASEGGVELMHAGNDVSNVASLQRGARNFVNYCMGCHSAKFVRYNRLAADLGLSEQQVRDNLMFTGEKTSDTMKSVMSEKDAARWFGAAPPDLSVMARYKSADYIFTFLKSFHVDPKRPTGANNHVLEGAAMPNVLAELQGLQKTVYEGESDKDGHVQKRFKGFESVSKGAMTPEQFDDFVRDTVNFLDYIAEPVQMTRRNLGVGVMLFLLVFWGLAHFLKKEYWKDVN